MLDTTVNFFPSPHIAIFQVLQGERLQFTGYLLGVLSRDKQGRVLIRAEKLHTPDGAHIIDTKTVTIRGPYNWEVIMGRAKTLREQHTFDRFHIRIGPKRWPADMQRGQFQFKASVDRLNREIPYYLSINGYYLASVDKVQPVNVQRRKLIV